MPLQILSLKLDSITAGDYLAWCRDPDPPALGFGLRSVHVDADPLGDTITATLDWNQPPPPPLAAATAAGLPPLPGTRIHALMTSAAPAIDLPSVVGRDGLIDSGRRPATRLPAHHTIARNRPTPLERRRHRNVGEGSEGRSAEASGPARRDPTGSLLQGPDRSQVAHELSLALTDLGGATFALAYRGALNDGRLAPRVQRINELFTQLSALDHPTHTRPQNDEPVTAVAA